MGLKRYRLVFFVVFLVLLGLESFALVKSPFIFVGLEERVWPFLLAVFILLVASFIPWRILRNMHKVVNLLFLIFLGFSFVNIFWLDFKVIEFLIATYILGGIKLLLEHFHKKKDLFLREEVYKCLFLAMLILISLGSFFDFFSSRMTGLSIITILLGVFVFYYNRDVIDEIEDEKEDEEKAEQKRAKEFDRKFPKLAWFNFDYGITKNWKEKRYFVSILRALAAPFIWFARLPYSFVKWMYKEGWWYSVSVISLMVIGLLIRIYNLGELGLWWDELNTGRIVTRIIETGLPLEPSELTYYWRGVAYHYFVALFTVLFRNTEFWLRLPSVIFGLGIVFMSFYFSKKINKKAALIVLIFLIFSTYNIEYSRFARFYIMNSFLFMIGIWTFWEGFFKDKRKYKILSTVIFLLMLHVVQFGMIYITVWGVLIIYAIKDKKLLKKENALFLIFSVILLLVGNWFERLISIEPSLKSATTLTGITEPVKWRYLQFPKWHLFSFFNQNYFPIILVFIALIISLISIAKIRKKPRLVFFRYLVFTLFVSVIAYEIGCRDVTGARIFLFAEPLIACIGILSILFVIKLFDKKHCYTLTAIIFLVVLINIHPLFYERITLSYGDDVTNDAFRTTHVASYRSDYKTTYEYLKRNIKEDDIWINVMGNNYFSFKSNPDYIINQNVRWNTNSLVTENGEFISPRNKATLINTVEEIKEIIDKNERVWLLINGGSVNVLYTTHVRSDFLSFVNQHKENVVYESPDNLSKILFFSN